MKDNLEERPLIEEERRTYARPKVGCLPRLLATVLFSAAIIGTSVGIYQTLRTKEYEKQWTSYHKENVEYRNKVKQLENSLESEIASIREIEEQRKRELEEAYSRQNNVILENKKLIERTQGLEKELASTSSELKLRKENEEREKQRIIEERKREQERELRAIEKSLEKSERPIQRTPNVQQNNINKSGNQNYILQRGETQREYIEYVYKGNTSIPILERKVTIRNNGSGIIIEKKERPYRHNNTNNSWTNYTVEED